MFVDKDLGHLTNIDLPVSSLFCRKSRTEHKTLTLSINFRLSHLNIPNAQNAETPDDSANPKTPDLSPEKNPV